MTNHPKESPILGLPQDYRPDKGVAFNQIPA